MGIFDKLNVWEMIVDRLERRLRILELKIEIKSDQKLKNIVNHGLDGDIEDLQTELDQLKEE